MNKVLEASIRKEKEKIKEFLNTHQNNLDQDMKNELLKYGFYEAVERKIKNKEGRSKKNKKVYQNVAKEMRKYLKDEIQNWKAVSFSVSDLEVGEYYNSEYIYHISNNYESDGSLRFFKPREAEIGPMICSIRVSLFSEEGGYRNVYNDKDKTFEYPLSKNYQKGDNGNGREWKYPFKNGDIAYVFAKKNKDEPHAFLGVMFHSGTTVNDNGIKISLWRSEVITRETKGVAKQPSLNESGKYTNSDESAEAMIAEIISSRMKRGINTEKKSATGEDIETQKENTDLGKKGEKWFSNNYKKWIESIKEKNINGLNLEKLNAPEWMNKGGVDSKKPFDFVFKDSKGKDILLIDVKTTKNKTSHFIASLNEILLWNKCHLDKEGPAYMFVNLIGWDLSKKESEQVQTISIKTYIDLEGLEKSLQKLSVRFYSKA